MDAWLKKRKLELILAFLLPTSVQHHEAQPATLPAALANATDESRLTFVSGEYRLNCEVARSQEKQRRGLMFRQGLAQDACMAFVYTHSAIRSFHMRDTRLPLSIAFLDSSLRVISVKNLRPLDEWPVSSDAPVRVVLEANLHWFKTAGVRAGSLLVLSRDEPVRQPP